MAAVPHKLDATTGDERMACCRPMLIGAFMADCGTNGRLLAIAVELEATVDPVHRLAAGAVELDSGGMGVEAGRAADDGHYQVISGWSPRQASNLQHAAWKAAALPIELLRQ